MSASFQSEWTHGGIADDWDDRADKLKNNFSKARHGRLQEESRPKTSKKAVHRQTMPIENTVDIPANVAVCLMQWEKPQQPNIRACRIPDCLKSANKPFSRAQELPGVRVP